MQSQPRNGGVSVPEQHPGIASPGRRDDLVELLTYGRDGHAAQSVIGTQRNDQDRRLLAQDLIEARQALRARVAMASCIDDAPGMTLSLQAPLQHRREARV